MMTLKGALADIKTREAERYLNIKYPNILCLRYAKKVSFLPI